METNLSGWDIYLIKKITGIKRERSDLYQCSLFSQMDSQKLCVTDCKSAVRICVCVCVCVCVCLLWSVKIASKKCFLAHIHAAASAGHLPSVALEIPGSFFCFFV